MHTIFNLSKIIPCRIGRVWLCCWRSCFGNWNAWTGRPTYYYPNSNQPPLGKKRNSFLSKMSKEIDKNIKQKTCESQTWSGGVFKLHSRQPNVKHWGLENHGSFRESEISPIKSNQEIGISHLLTLPLQGGGVVQYEIVGTVEHVGDQPFGGHYVANLWDGKDSIWYTANDSQALKKSDLYEEFDRKRSAVFLYKRVKSDLEGQS